MAMGSEVNPRPIKGKETPEGVASNAEILRLFSRFCPMDSLSRVDTFNHSNCWSNVQLLADLLFAGASPHQHVVHGEPMIYSTSCYGRLDAIILLLACGANPDAVDTSRSEIPLYRAFPLKDIELAVVLLEAGANITQFYRRYGATPLHYAVHFCFRKGVQLMLDYGSENCLRVC